MCTNPKIELRSFLRLFCLICVYSIWIIGFADQKAVLPANCQTDCSSAFGTELGRSPKGVKAYSNCNNQCVYPEPFFLDKVFTGIQWQCVEYARRWLLSQRHVVYGDVDVAADIWDLDYVVNPDTGQSFRFMRVPNGGHDNDIQQGDLLIYDKAYQGTGHVAVVTQVDHDKGVVAIAEQNFFNMPWKGLYARRINIAQDGDQLWLMDAYLIGWKRVLNDQNLSIGEGAL